MQETQVRSLGWEDALEEGMATHSSVLARESHGQRSLVGYSPWGHKDSDMTERLNNNNTDSLQVPYNPESGKTASRCHHFCFPSGFFFCLDLE